jgi:hypothetical protein
MAIESDGFISIKTSLALKKNDFQQNHFALSIKGTTPLKNIKLMNGGKF